MAVEIRAATYAALRTALAAGTYQAGQPVFVEGRAAAGDGGQGPFQVKFDAGGGFVDDGGVTIASADGKWAAVRNTPYADPAYWGSDGAAIEAAAESGLPVVFATQQTYTASDTVSVAHGVDFDMRTSEILYSGPRDRVVLQIGTSGVANTASILNLSFRAETLDWSDADFVGVRLINSQRANISVRSIARCAVGLDLYSVGQGVAHNKISVDRFYDCKHMIALTCDGSAGTNYANENNFFGGDFSNTSSSNLLGDCAAVLFRSVNSGYTAHNANRFWGPCFQPGDGQSGDVRIPIQFDGCGARNTFHDVRYESGRGPLMKCDGPVGDGVSSAAVVASNRATCIVSAGSHIEVAVEETGSARLNIVHGSNDGEAQASQAIDNLHRLITSYSSTHTAARGPIHIADNSATPALALSNGTFFRVLKDSVAISSTRLLGFFVDTDGGESFELFANYVSGFSGRFVVVAFGADGARLTNLDSGYPHIIIGEGSTYNYWTASYGGAYYIASNVDAMKFTVRPQVKKIQVLAAQGSGELRIKGFRFTRLTPKNSPMAVYSGLNTDPSMRYAASDPSAGINGVFYRGDLVLNDAAPSGAGTAFWQCTLGGRLAPAWAGATAYVAGDLVLNDTNKIYECVTSGTSAASGGPTGTGAGIADGTAVWDYLSPKAVTSAKAF